MGISTSPSDRFLGLSAGVGGALLVIWSLIDTPFPIFLPVIGSSHVLHPLFGVARLFGSLSLLLISLGLVAAYNSPILRGGLIAVSGWILGLLTTSILGGIFFYQAVVIPGLAAHTYAIFDPSGSTYRIIDANLWFSIWAIGFGLAYVLFGITLLRSSGKIRWTGLLMIIGAPLFATGTRSDFIVNIVPVFGAVLFGLGHILANIFMLPKRGGMP